MKAFLTKSNVFGMAISTVLGVFGNLISPQMPALKEKVVFAICMAACCVFYCFIVEKRAIKHFDRKLQITIRGNPLLSTALLQTALLIGGAGFLYVRMPLSSMINYFTFSLLTYFFVSGLFETYRLLRR